MRRDRQTHRHGWHVRLQTTRAIDWRECGSAAPHENHCRISCRVSPHTQDWSQLRLRGRKFWKQIWF